MKSAGSVGGGTTVGAVVGFADAPADGAIVGVSDGESEARDVGTLLGDFDGVWVIVGEPDGFQETVGAGVGLTSTEVLSSSFAMAE